LKGNKGKNRMNIELKDLVELLGTKKTKASPPFEIGKNYFVRTVTMYYVGTLVDIKGQWLVLNEASWICDTGRFHDFLKDGKCNEYEAFVDQVRIPMGSVIDVTDWKHVLFKGQK
jgi:hypothetical protein